MKHVKRYSVSEELSNIVALIVFIPSTLVVLAAVKQIVNAVERKVARRHR